MNVRNSLMIILKRFVILLALMLLIPRTLTVVKANSEPRTWTVDDDGLADFNKIQEAINAANDGDTIYVKKGVYHENVVVNKTLALIGEETNATVIDGMFNGYENMKIAVEICAGNVRISGFTLQNSTWGILMRRNAVSAIVSNNKLIDNRRGMHVETGCFNITISNNLIGFCKWESDGICLVGVSSSLIVNNTVTGCSYGISLHNGSYNIIRNNTVVNINTGISLYGESHNNAFLENNVSKNIYGFYLSYSYANEFSHNDIINNTYQVHFDIADIVQNIVQNTTWDDGYPSGGNFWSDYTGNDTFFGPYQNITGNDGIGDTPYIINAKNLDRYPLMTEVRQPRRPVADFMWAPSIYKVESVTFNASSSIPGYKGMHTLQIVLYSWNFGDNSTATGQLVNHTYAHPGNYRVTLNVTDSEGLWDAEQKQLILWGSSSLTISLDASTTYAGYRINISGKLSYHEKDIPESNLLLSYSVTKGETWNDITSVITAPDGGFSAQWMPTATGNDLVRVIWDGNETLYLKGSEAYTTLAVTQLEEKYVFSVISNSTVSELAFNSTSRLLSFTVSGPSGTTGYINITIAKSLIGDINELKVYLDGNQINYNAISIGDSWLLYFYYQHSVHKVAVILGPPLSKPFIETPVGMVTIGGVVLAVIAAILTVLKRKINHGSQFSNISQFN